MFKIYNSNRKYIDNFSIIKKKIAFCLLFSLFFNLIALSVTREDVYNYIDKYKNAALIEQRNNGIPVSITLAQGLLESAAGTSRLAREGNNHFGVKCHRSYRGDSTHIGTTCYRKYRTVHDSYLDHSKFLKGKRYQELFSLDIKRQERPVLKHPTKRRNGLNYIMAVLGDNYQDIAQEYNIKLSKLLDYNDLASAQEQPQVGDIIYVNKKHSEAQGEHYEYRVEANGESLWYISQLYGVRLKDLAKLNNLKPDATLHKGDIIKFKR